MKRTKSLLITKSLLDTFSDTELFDLIYFQLRYQLQLSIISTPDFLDVVRVSL